MIFPIKIENLTKEFQTSFTFRKIPALTDLSLTVAPGEIFGYVGPNGSGKTTTFKLLTGLIRPTRGKIYLWGEQAHHLPLKSRIGFLPESPYFYGYLKASEYLHFAAQLFDLNRRERERRVGALLERVGLKPFQNERVRAFSKGMMQRLGLAQALINDPELVILDEPMSGLDPMGRKEVRDLMLELKEAGKTIIFSTHILSDVEVVCDRVGIVIKGVLKACGPLENLLSPKIESFEVCVRDLPEEAILQLQQWPFNPIQRGKEFYFKAAPGQVDDLLAYIREKDGKLVSLVPRKETLEDLYVNEMKTNGANGRE